MSDISRATSLEAVDTHIDYIRRDTGEMRRDIAKLLEAVSHMATRDDIKRIEDRLTGYATREDLRALEAKLSAQSVPSTIERWAGWVTKLGSAAAIVGGGALLVANLVEKLR